MKNKYLPFQNAILSSAVQAYSVISLSSPGLFDQSLSLYFNGDNFLDLFSP